MSSFLRAALPLVDRGFLVHPCEPRGKRPLVDRGFHAATADLVQLERWDNRWPNANPASPVPPGHLVVDIDVHHGGDATWAALEAQHGSMPATLTTRTGTGGRHIWLTLDGPVRQTAGLLGPGIDTRTAGRGYLIMPGAVNADGHPYEWERTDPIAPAPAWLAELLRPRPLSPHIPLLSPHRRGAGYGEAALAGECDDVATTPPGARNARLNAAAFRLGRLVAADLLGAERAVDGLLAAAAAAGLGESEAVKTITSGLRAGLASPVSVTR